MDGYLGYSEEFFKNFTEIMLKKKEKLHFAIYSLYFQHASIDWQQLGCVPPHGHNWYCSCNNKCKPETVDLVVLRSVHLGVHITVYLAAICSDLEPSNFQSVTCHNSALLLNIQTGLNRSLVETVTEHLHPVCKHFNLFAYIHI